MRRICVFTGSRADYGPLRPLIRALHDDPEVELRLLVTGSHLATDQGLTVDHIIADGFSVDRTVDMVLSGDTPTAIAKSLGLGVIGYSDALDQIEPDILVVLGDRYEALAIAAAATPLLLPIAHIAGGQLTAGSTDDAVRHAITKLAHLHFTSTEQFRTRILQLGEEASRVHSVGALGLDTVFNTHFLDRIEIEETIGVAAGKEFMMVTYHPATLERTRSDLVAMELFEALDEFPNLSIVLTASNVDAGGRRMNMMAETYRAQQGHRITIHRSLGQLQYLSLVKYARVVIGNSSSGLIEAPALQTSTVNIGPRQDGRPRAASVVDSGESAPEIIDAIKLALSPDHQAVTRRGSSPYGDGKTAPRVVRVLKEVSLTGLIKKSFVDVNWRIQGSD